MLGLRTDNSSVGNSRKMVKGVHVLVGACENSLNCFYFLHENRKQGHQLSKDG